MNGPRGYYAKWNKSENDKYRMILLICGTWKIKQMNKHKTERVIDTENKQVAARGEGGVGGWVK